jgi:DeoR family transcriptional regulator of aga operon
MSREESEALPAALRRSRMLDVIGDRGFVRVGELSDAFGVSDVTVRTDLDALEATGAIKRVHGGAVPRGAVAPRELSFEESLASSAEEKRAIALAAAGMIEPGMSVLLDVGTTTAAVARAIVARDELRDVTVITNGLTIALELEAAIGRIEVIVTGGTLRPLQHSLVAPLASVLLDHVNADLAFIGCNGVDARRGVTNVNLPEAELKSRMVASARRAVVVADGSKLGQVHLGTVAPLARFETVLTSASADEKEVLALREAGATVRIAERRT